MPSAIANPETTGQRLIDGVHAQRSLVGIAFLILALAALIGAGFFGTRLIYKPPVTETEQPSIIGGEKADLTDKKPAGVLFVSCMIASLGLGAVGGFFVGTIPSQDTELRRRKDRTLLLVGGLVLGLANVLCGLTLLIFWFDKLAKWVISDKGSHTEAWLPAAAILQFVLGCGIALLGTVPARAEERRSKPVRLLVYGVNFGVSIALILIGLTTANVLFSLKLPEKLDATVMGSYPLSKASGQYLRGLKFDVKIDAILPDASGSNAQVKRDTERLLQSCQDANPKRLTVNFLSPVADKSKIAALQAEATELPLKDSVFGILIRTGENFQRRAFVPFDKLMKPDEETRKTNYIGEAELLRAMMSKTEQESVAYFTQSNRELAVFPPRDAMAPPPERTAYRLKDDLELGRCTAKSLEFQLSDPNPSVPDDADLVVVLDPLTTLLEPTVNALRKYLTAPRKNGKKGKLLVFVGANPPAKGKGVLSLGLEEMLKQDFGIILIPGQVYQEPRNNRPSEFVLIQAMARDARKVSPIHRYIGEDPVEPNRVRAVVPSREPTERGGANLLMASMQGLSWIEPEVGQDPAQVWQALVAADKRGDGDYKNRRRLGQSSIPVAAYADDRKGQTLAVVFGFADGLNDADRNRPFMSRLLTTTADWLRDRPAAPDINPKTFISYTPKKGVDTTRLLWVPVLGTAMLIVVLGLGVWIARRK